MSKLAEYMLVLSEDGTEHARYRSDRAGAMARFGLTEVEQDVVLRGTPAAMRLQIHGESRQPEPVAIQGDDDKPPQPPKPQ